MRIAFVGKGGSGKTTLCGLFITYLLSRSEKVFAVDADINMHLSDMLGLDKDFVVDHGSFSEKKDEIKSYLKGENILIHSVSEFVKTTPPGQGSRWISIEKGQEDVFLKKYTTLRDTLYFGTVGTYEMKDIGASCYHNHLSVFENIISHTNDYKHWLVADMVAGTDAFASSLFAQFDLLVLVVEPTKKGLEVFKQFQKLSENNSLVAHVKVLVNKVRDAEDFDFVERVIPKESILGYIYDLEIVRKHERDESSIRSSDLDEQTMHTFSQLVDVSTHYEKSPSERYSILAEVHKTYVSQNFIIERHGDLNRQIDFAYLRDRDE